MKESRKGYAPGFGSAWGWSDGSLEKMRMVLSGVVSGVLILAWICVAGVSVSLADGQEGYATYYTVASCQREGTSGIRTASGRPYRETEFTCALPHRDFGGLYRVSTSRGRSVLVRHTDYGPGKKARLRGVVIDLTPAAFRAIGLRQRDGRGKVTVKRIR